MSIERASVQAPGIFRRAASAVCPPADRRWLDAMFAELAFVDGRGQRLRWLFGAGAIVTAVIRARTVAVVPAPVLWAAAIALPLALVFAAGAALGFEGLGIDDDVYLLAATVSSVLVLALAAITISRTFRGQPALPRGHR